MAKFCVHEQHGGICEKTGGYCNLGACPYEDLREFAEVRHAKWISEEHEDRVSPTMTHKYTWYYCSECGRRLVGYSKTSDAPYCHCGARMDLEV